MKKKIFLSAAFMFAAMFVFGTIDTKAQSAPVVGGYQKVKKSDDEVKKAIDFAMKEQGEYITLKKIKKAEQQVVAGMNYKVTLQFAEKQGDKESKFTVNAVIYRDLEGNYSVTQWERATK